MQEANWFSQMRTLRSRSTDGSPVGKTAALSKPCVGQSVPCKPTLLVNYFVRSILLNWTFWVVFHVSPVAVPNNMDPPTHPPLLVKWRAISVPFAADAHAVCGPKTAGFCENFYFIYFIIYRASSGRRSLNWMGHCLASSSLNSSVFPCSQFVTQGFQ